MKVLIAVEGSEFSKNALTKAGEIFGARDDVEFIIVSAVEPIIPPIEPFAVSAEYIQKIDDEAREASESFLDDSKLAFEAGYPQVVGKVTSELLIGAPAQMIVEAAESWGADVIVMGSHGYGFWQRTMLGSVPNTVLHHAPCSVMIVRSTDVAG